MRNLLITLCIATILAACGTTHTFYKDNLTNLMEFWVGRQKSDLIRSWGPPQQYASDGKDGEILIYEHVITHTNTIDGAYYEQTTRSSKMFYADAYGNIYYWRTGE